MVGSLELYIRPERSHPRGRWTTSLGGRTTPASQLVVAFASSRRDARPLPARRQGHLRAQQQCHGEAAPREDFQGATNRANHRRRGGAGSSLAARRRARRTRRCRAQVTEGARDHGSNQGRGGAVCLCCWVDAVTGGASRPDDLWYYSIKYDDGEEEHKVGPARIFPNFTVVVRASAGSLGVFIARDASHRVTELRASGPLAGRVAVGDRLVSISTPGRALFTCGPTATGLDIIDELRAGAGSDGRVLTFARVDFASLDDSVCDRLQQYVDAQPSRCGPRTCLCGAPKHLVCWFSGIALVGVVPAVCGILYFGFHCFADLYGATT